MSDKKTAENAMLYHSLPRPGKIEVVPTKALVTQEDLSLAYTPGVADVCLAIESDAEQANKLTSKGNLVAVITNGTAVLGLGDIGPLASKPVMEGKGVLFKKFANIDVFDIEIDEKDPKKFVDTVERLAPTFGGINLEDIKAPECFEIEEELKKRLNIPVMHDDQHGTAIIALSAFINSLRITKKKVEDVQVVCSGAGAAGLSCMHMVHDYGVPMENITVLDRSGVVYKGRENMNERLEPFANDTNLRTLDDAIEGADYFFGLSAAGVLKPEMVKKMGEQPVIFAMANPKPEIMPDEARKARPDAIIGTGRSDFPNQINNVLGFPFLFRGALDVGATEINTEMKIAAATALAELARKAPDASLAKAYKGSTLKFGPEYLIPKPFDPRLLQVVSSAVAKAAMDSGVATRPIDDFDQYEHKLSSMVDQSFTLMRRIFNEARRKPGKVVFPEAEDPRILQAAESLIHDGLAYPILIGRTHIVEEQLKKTGVNLTHGENCTFIDPNKYEKIDEYAETYYDMRKRDGILPPEAEIILRTRSAALGSMMVREGDADAMVVGVTGRMDKFLRATTQIIGTKPGVSSIYALQLVMAKDKVLFFGDTHVNENPTAEQLAEMARLAHEEVPFFGVDPRIALVSHSNFGSSKSPNTLKMAQARRIVKEKWPEISIEGEMQCDSALNMETLARVFPDADMSEPANILLMPDVDSANITFNLMQALNDGEYIGPILLGMEKPVHILNVGAPVRRIVQMAALAVVEAQNMKDQKVKTLKKTG